MFNDDQTDHMRYLSLLPVEQKCPCGWNVKFSCYNCNVKELVKLGGHVKGDDLILPNGSMIDYIGLCKCLQLNTW